ncbi:serine protease [Thiomicrorhabdus immobilis]|uniref:Serine protease n=1 Tax=Thiomicrorhabdus immobilis TaxID=2791037 RepID=A0ABN6D251_9GAMM|nr:patatin-like phospholipase family protein [Thiomicrorhabdus immobilis]BCN94262.1 serine protease [Thiomicrorhabdus immobilis]
MTNPTTTQPKNISLVLGSGGARGLAHIGIIRWLEEHDYQIQSISGSSIGALIGGLYACGKLDEFEHWLKKLSKSDILALFDIAWDRSGLIRGEKLHAVLTKLIGTPRIEELRIPYTAVATDINNEKEVWLQSGDLLQAMRASYSLPMIFTPVKYKGLTLIDGGVINPVPIAPTFGQGSDLTIAVNLGAKPKPPTFEQNAETKDESDWLDFDELIANIKEFFTIEKKALKQSFDWDVYDISNKAFDSMQSSIARQQLAAYPPDITIDIPRNACGMLEFTQVEKMVKLGYDTAQQTLAEDSVNPE